MEIVLLRHGRPEVDLLQRIRASEIPRLSQAYRQASIVDQPTDAARAVAQRCNVTVCSNLPRSLQTAHALGIEHVHLSDALFAEVEMPYVTFPSVGLPALLWAALFRSIWGMGFSRNGESMRQAKQRAQQAALKLEALAAQHQRVLLVGHGVVNYFIAKQLLSRGWQGPAIPGWRHWQFGVYQNT